MYIIININMRIIIMLNINYYYYYQCSCDNLYNLYHVIVYDYYIMINMMKILVFKINRILTWKLSNTHQNCVNNVKSWYISDTFVYSIYLYHFEHVPGLGETFCDIPEFKFVLNTHK